MPEEAIKLDTRRLEALLPPGLSDSDRDLLLQVAARGVAAVNAGDAQVAQDAAKVFTTVFADNASDGTSPWESCGSHCEKLVNEGKAPEYAVCYWACVARGGPDAVTISEAANKLAQTVVHGDRVVRDHRG